jgi:acylphosphatase
VRVRKVLQVRGRVQGVGFRYFAVGIARNLDLVGIVANLPDGSVKAVVEGDEKDVKSFIDRLREGPPASHVESMDVRDEKPTGDLDQFEIVFGEMGGTY